MTPGPKKKGSQHKLREGKSDDHRKENTRVVSTKVQNAKDPIEKIVQEDPQANGSDKYRKGVIESNWERYKEPEEVAYADVSRGRDYEVLLSYAGGAGSQMQLQEEREWDEFKVETSNLTVDLNHLGNLLKCIPFHRRLDLPEDVFDAGQIEKFIKVAKMNQQSYCTSGDVFVPPKVEEQLNTVPQISKIAEYNVAENVNEIDADNVVAKNGSVSGKTESLIESLSQCLSIVDNSEVKSEVVNIESQPCAKESDDLDFLLSLTMSQKSETSQPGATSTKLDKSNVDEWLSTILDD